MGIYEDTDACGVGKRGLSGGSWSLAIEVGNRRYGMYVCININSLIPNIRNNLRLEI